MLDLALDGKHCMRERGKHDVRYAQVSTTLVSFLNFLNLVFLVCYIDLIIAPISSVFVHNKCQRDTNTADSIGLWWEATGII